MGEQPERLCQRPAGQGVGRVALVEDRDGRFVLGIAEVGVEDRQLGACKKGFVDDGAAGEGADVEVIYLEWSDFSIRGRDPPANDVQFALKPSFALQL